MKGIFTVLRHKLDAVSPNGAALFDATRRELSAAAADVRKLYGRNWSDRVHL